MSALDELMADETVQASPAASPAPEIGSAPAQAPASGGALDELDAEENRPGMLESAGRGLLQGVSLGFSDELTGLAESAFTPKTYLQSRNEARAANAAAREANPWAYGLSEVAGGVALPGLGAGGALAKVGLRGVAAAAGAGALEGAVQGVGTADDGDAVRSGVLGALTGGALGGIGGKLFGKYAAGAESRAVRNVTKDLGEGALPTAQRRFAEIRDLAFDELAPDKAFMKVAREKPAEAAEVAAKRLDEFGSKTAPIYKKLDAEAGRVPVQAVTGHLDNAIETAAKNFADDGTADVLREVRDRFVSTAKANGGADTVSHQDVRKWVTGLLKHKTRVMGSISETQSFELAAEAHKVANDFLKSHLDDVGRRVPGLAPDLEKLSGLNKKIRAWASAEALMENKAGREFWKREPGKFVSGMSAALGVGGVAAAGHPIGAAAALLPPSMRGLARAGRSLDRSATMALARLQRAARAGDASKALYLEAIKAGVPASAAVGAIGGMNNLRAILRGDPQEEGAAAE